MGHLLSCLFILFFSISVYAGEYSPPGLYEADHITLENGLKVVLNPREGAHNTSIRLVVEVGKHDFTHGKKETAHFLEHLLFAGTSKHSEEELEKIIDLNGGRWNAQTRWFSTVYSIDIYSGSSFLALDTLYEIISDSTIATDKVELTRDIIHRESDGRPSKIRRWLYARGIGKSAFSNAYDILLPDFRFEHINLETADDISRDEIMAAYKKYYVPNNMTLIVVGEFDRIALMKQVGTTFGVMENKPLTRSKDPVPPYPNEPAEVSGTLSPILGTDGRIAIAFRTDGANSDDYHTLWILRNFLDTRMYDSLRIRQGLAYGPGAIFHVWEHFGTFSLTADVNIVDTDKTLSKIWDLLEEITEGKVDHEAMEKTKRGMLLRLSQSYETNAAKADYYADFLHDLKSNDAFIDAEERIEKITPEEVVQAAKKYLSKDRAVIIRSLPSLTYTQLYLVIAFASALIFFSLVIFIRHRRRKKKKRKLGLEFIP